MKRKKVFRDDIPVSILIPAELQIVLLEKAEREDLNFSQVVRRALRKELNKQGERSGLCLQPAEVGR